MRLFIAIPVDAELKRRLQEIPGQLDLCGAKVRWCSADQLHLTLKFIGETPTDQVDPICDATRRVAAAVRPFAITAMDCGCFPKSGAVRVIWVGVPDLPDQMVQLFQGLEEALGLLGVPKEKRTLSLHFTLGRVKYDPSGGRLSQVVTATPFAASAQQIDQVVVYQSELTPAGARHTALARAVLRSEGQSTSQRKGNSR